jgi:hypothetical protein
MDNKQGYIHRMKYYLVIKIKELGSHKNGGSLIGYC